MGDMLQSQVHVTAWPGLPLPLPQAYKVESKLTDEGVVVPCPRGEYGRDWQEEPVKLDGETYLRLAAVNLDDPTAIFAFTAEYGVLGGAEAYDAVMAEAPYAFANLLGPRLNATAEREKRIHAVEREQVQSKSEGVWPTEALRFHFTETLDEFRFAARCLRDLTSAWRMFKECKAANEVEWVSPVQSDEELLKEDGFALFLLSHALPRWFLRPFSPALWFSWPHVGPPGGPAYSNLAPRHHSVSVQPSRDPIGGRLYSICALELYNHMVENADYLICGNENCRQKNFVHQHALEKNWHRSKGVRYCSYACAHATAQREYRRRRRG